MRVLFTTQPGLGHFHPLVPLARAAAKAGHEVVFASAPTFCRETMGPGGFQCFPAGLDWTESEVVATFPRLGELPPGEEADNWWMTDIFAGPVARQMVPELLQLANAWFPDVIVHDPYDFSGPLAAEVLGVPYARSGPAIFDSPQEWKRIVGAELDALRRRSALPPDPDFAWMYRYLDLALAPPYHADPNAFVSPVTHFLRPVSFDVSGDERLPEWIEQLAPRPTVYATLGTVFNRVPGVLASIVEGARELDINLIVTAGRNQAPEQFGPQPPNVYAERYIPQTLLLPHCDAIITHGGFNTVMAAITYELPMVIVPLGSDQPYNAQRYADLGAARVVIPDQDTAPAVREALADVLHNPTYRQAARCLHDELLTLPEPAHGVTLLESLAREKTPILRPAELGVQLCSAWNGAILPSA